jgi:cell division transport system permease protein
MPISIGYVARETATNLWRNLLMTVAAVLTVAVSLSLVGGALLLRQGVTKATVQWRGGVELSIFMKPDVAPEQSKAVERELSSLDEYVKRYSYVDQQEAKREFDLMFANTPEMTETVEAKDLPPSYRVVPRKAELVDVIGTRFQKRAGVQDVVYAKEAIETQLRVTQRRQLFFLGMAAVVLLAATLLIFNTIQLAIFARRREVAVMKLVGATNWFIRLPFMFEGMAAGLVGAFIASALLYFFRDFVMGLVSDPTIGTVEELYATPAEALGTGIFLMIVGAVVGGIGSAVAVRRYLDV